MGSLNCEETIMESPTRMIPYQENLVARIERSVILNKNDQLFFQ